MKIFSIIFVVILSNCALGQVKSYYFSKPTPGKTVNKVDPSLYGQYADGKGRTYSFSDSGLYLLSTTVSSISRETLRESSTYRVENGFLFGILPNDSIPCIAEEDYYIFGIRNRDPLIAPTTKHKLVQSSKFPNTYFLNMYENGVYNLIRLNFVKGELLISSFDYEPETTVFNSIADQQSNDNGQLSIVLLNPSESEFADLLQYGIFDAPKAYKRVK